MLYGQAVSYRKKYLREVHQQDAWLGEDALAEREGAVAVAVKKAQQIREAEGSEAQPIADKDGGSDENKDGGKGEADDPPLGDLMPEKREFSQNQGRQQQDGVLFAAESGEEAEQTEDEPPKFSAGGGSAAQVGVDGGDAEHGRHGGHALDDVGDCLRLDGGEHPEERAEQGGGINLLRAFLFLPVDAQEQAQRQEKKPCSQDMNRDIDCMVSPDAVLSEIPVQAEGQAREGAVQLPAFRRGWICAYRLPELFKSQLGYLQCLVVPNIRLIVKMPRRLECVGISNEY